MLHSSPLIADWDGVCVRVDGRPAGKWLRGRSTSGAVIYMDNSVPAYTLPYLASEEGDTIMGSPTDGTIGLKLQGARGRITFHYADVWGVDGRGNEVATKLSAIRADCDAHSVKYKPTAAATARGLLLAMVPEMRQLAPRWRDMAHNSLHAAPIVHCMASAPVAAHVDRNAAFLDALRQPFPLPTARYWLDRSGCMAGDGIADCLVSVPESIIDIPPLPIQCGGYSHSPVGMFRGVWPLPWVRWAKERGLCVTHKVYAIARCEDAEPWLVPYADKVDAMGAARKPLYQRLWGLAASKGRWTGRIKAYADAHSVGCDGVYWTYAGVGVGHTPPSYRPDVSAYVCARNALAMASAQERLHRGSIVAAHLDCYWTTDIDGAGSLVREGGWKITRVAPVRVYAPGVYHHGSRLGCAGWPVRGGGPGPGKHAAWASQGEAPRSRVWDRSPRTCADATSGPGYPPDEYRGPQYQAPPPWARDAWTQGGYPAMEDSCE